MTTTDPFSGIPNAGGTEYEGTILATGRERTTALDREAWHASPAERAGTDLLTGPFIPSWQLVDYRDTPGYAIPPRDLPKTEDRKD